MPEPNISEHKIAIDVPGWGLSREISLRVDHTKGTIDVRGAKRCTVWNRWDEYEPGDTTPDEVGVSVHQQESHMIEVELHRNGTKPWWRGFSDILWLKLFNFGKGYSVPGEGFQAGTKVSIHHGACDQVIARAPFKGPEFLDAPTQRAATVAG